MPGRVVRSDVAFPGGRSRQPEFSSASSSGYLLHGSDLGAVAEANGSLPKPRIQAIQGFERPRHARARVPLSDPGLPYLI